MRQAVRSVVVAAGLTASAPYCLSAQFPTEPPPPAPQRPVQFPPFQEATLPGGLRLVVIEHHEQPVLSIRITFPAGSFYDPAGKEGLAAMVAELLTKGTEGRTAEQIAATIEGAGGSLVAGADQDFLTAFVDVLSDRADLAFELLGDVLRRSTYPAEELDLARTRAISALQLELSQPSAIAGRLFAREIYGTHPYGRRPTDPSYRAITRDDVARFAGERLRPGGALLVVAGDITLPRARALVERHFRGWSGTTPAAPPPPPIPAADPTELVLAHRPGSAQANIVMGNTTFGPTDPRVFPARLAVHVLGGGPDSRLFLLLREEKGWTYGAYAGLDRPRGVGTFEATAETRTEVADSALRELLHQVDRIRTEAIPDSELVNAKGFLVGSFPLSIETPNQIAQQVARVKLLGLGDDYLRTYRDRLSAVTAAQARDAAARSIHRDRWSIVVVGDAAALRPKLEGIAPIRLVDVDGSPLDPAVLRAAAGPRPALDRAQLVARTDSFRIMVQGNPFGSDVKSLTVDGDSLTYRESTSLGPIQQQSTVVLEAADLTMRRTDQTGTVQGQPAEVHLVYAAGRVRGQAQTPQPTGTPKTIQVDTTVASDVVDDNALSLVVPALPLAEGASFTLSVFSSGEGVPKTMTVKVAGTDSVTVPAGAFSAYRVEIAGGQLPIVMYVSRGTPRRLVKIELVVVGAPLVFELTTP